MRYITVQEYVKGILNTLGKPYSADIIDQVFQAIENNPQWLSLYREMVDAHGENPVNKSIQYNILGLTGMKKMAPIHNATSTLIENYPELG
jgi:hypothetical protein